MLGGKFSGGSNFVAGNPAWKRRRRRRRARALIVSYRILGDEDDDDDHDDDDASRSGVSSTRARARLSQLGAFRFITAQCASRVDDGSTTRFLCVILRGLGRQAGCCETDKEARRGGERETGRARVREERKKERERERKGQTSHEQPMKSSRPRSVSRNT